MRNPFRIGGFEKQLVVAFLIISVTPTVLIAVLGTRYLMRSVALVNNPAVEQAFTNSMSIARTLEARLEEDARSAAERLATEVSALPAAQAGGPASDRLQAVLERTCQETHSDFAAIYLREGTHWKLSASSPAGFARLERTIELAVVAEGEEALTPARQVTFADQDVIASGVATDSVLCVAGFALEKGFSDKMRRTGDDVGRYHAVGLYVSVLKPYIVILTIGLVACLVVFSTVISRLLARRISHPITELARATEEIAKGNLEYRVDVKARDEVLSLVDGFNKMTADLDENKRNLIRAERIAAWRDFARHFAHDIKNLLTPMEVAIYRINRRLEGETADADPARQQQVIQESLESIVKEVTALKNIAKEFSDFSKLPDTKLESLNVNDAVRSALELYGASAQGINVKTSFAQDLPAVQADREQLKSVIANLVKNACEAMPAGGTLSVRTSLVAGRVRLEITDTGPGIPEGIRAKIFDPYFTTKSGGTGMGLALVYRILTDHRAKIDFRTAETGTTFVVDLPVPEGGEGEETKP